MSKHFTVPDISWGEKMKIDSYSFGKIIVDGTKYTNDIIILKNRLIDSWWRKEGHKLYIADIEEALKEKPDILIVGTGAYGILKVQQETIDYLNELGIELIVLKTNQAVERFNKESKEKTVYAALHLTC